MELASIRRAFARARDVLAAPLEWVAGHIKKRPKGALILWVIALVVTAWVL
jgi:hypothetical protein